METTTDRINVGDILHSEYCGSGVRHNFYKVIKVSKTGMSVTVQALRKQYLGNPAAFTYDVAPTDTVIGKQMNRRVKTINGRPVVTIRKYEGYAEVVSDGVACVFTEEAD